MNNLIIIFFFFVLIIGLGKKIKCYDLFITGVKESSVTIINMFYFLLTFSIVTTLLDKSGILNFISSNLKIKNIELIIQMLIRPLSGSSSMTIMLNIFEKYGVDSKIGMISSLIHYISDSTFYLVTFYFGLVKCKEVKKAILLGLVINYISFSLVILICNILF